METIPIPAEFIPIVSTSSKGDPSKWCIEEKQVKQNTRVNADELLAELGLNAFNRQGIVRKTHGVMADDEIWLRFKGETHTRQDVSLRKSLYYPKEAQ